MHSLDFDNFNKKTRYELNRRKKMNRNRSDLKTRIENNTKARVQETSSLFINISTKKGPRTISSDTAINKIRIDSPEMIDIKDRIHDLF